MWPLGLLQVREGAASPQRRHGIVQLGPAAFCLKHMICRFVCYNYVIAFIRFSVIVSFIIFSVGSAAFREDPKGGMDDLESFSKHVMFNRAI